MEAQFFDMDNIDIAWCPGCGNFPILKILKQALAELEIAPANLVLVSGIGQAAKILSVSTMTIACQGQVFSSITHTRELAGTNQNI